MKEIINLGVVEENSTDEPVPWISCAVFAPKADGDIRVILDARNLNKAVLSKNLPIPRHEHEDIKVKMIGAMVFSKPDFMSVFWQLELSPESTIKTFNIFS